jgi:hypothetical protein
MSMEPTNPYASPQEAGPDASQIAPPVSLLEIITRGISLYVGNAPAVIGLMVLIMGPVELMQTYYNYFIRSAADPGGAFSMSYWIEVLVGILPTAGTIAIGDAAMRGERPNIWLGLRAGLEAWPRMILTRIIVSFFTLIGMIAFVIPGVYFAVRSVLAESVTVIEHANGMDSVRRSFELTLGQFWRYLVLSAATVVLLFVLGMLVAIPGALFPDIDHWLLSAGLALLVDVLAGVPLMIFVAGYWASAHPTRARIIGDAASTPPA